MRRGPLIAVLLVSAGLAGGVGLAWHRAAVRRTAAIVRTAVPPLPNLTAWPDAYASRLQEATAAARRMEQAPAALVEIARLYHANSCYREARQAELGLHALEPKNARWTCYLADACQNLGDQDGARKYLEETIRLAPYHAPARLKLADLLLKQGRVDEARTAYEWRLALVPRDPYARLGLARIDLQRGDRDGALAYLEATVRDSPDFPSAHNLLAMVYSQMGEQAKAADQRARGTVAGRFHEADDPWIDEIYGWTFDAFRLAMPESNRLLTRQFAVSLPFYKNAVHLAPHDGMAFDALGDIFMQLDRLDAARSTLEAGVAAVPKDQDLYLALARVLQRQRQPAEAITVLRQGTRSRPWVLELRLALGDALEEAGRSSEALPAYRVAGRLDPRSAQVRTRLGLCLLGLGLIREGRSNLERALALSREGTEVRQALNQALTRARAARDQASVSVIEAVLARAALSHRSEDPAAGPGV